MNLLIEKFEKDKTPNFLHYIIKGFILSNTEEDEFITPISKLADFIFFSKVSKKMKETFNIDLPSDDFFYNFYNPLRPTPPNFTFFIASALAFCNDYKAFNTILVYLEQEYKLKKFPFSTLCEKEQEQQTVLEFCEQNENPNFTHSFLTLRIMGSSLEKYKKLLEIMEKRYRLN